MGVNLKGGEVFCGIHRGPAAGGCRVSLPFDFLLPDGGEDPENMLGKPGGGGKETPR